MVATGWEALTPREAEVLAAVERRLGNAEIAAELSLSVRTVETHIAALRRKLDADSRAKLISAARARRAAVVQVPQNSFVGRDDDVRAVRALLAEHRWVTLVGPAGCGKTRLALELAAADARTPVVVELEHAGPDDVLSLLAKAIGLGVDSATDVATACGVALDTERYLLVLDNVDRVSPAVRAVVARLLTLSRFVTVLATSQAPVGGSDETVYPLAPLPVDGQPEGAAVRLFLDRARAGSPAGRLAAEDRELVTRICRRLDGLPLAVELAAARARHLTLPELAARLDDGFAALDRAVPDGRHRTLEAAFGWTWDLLDDSERWVLARLAALPRTFDLDLAEAVTRPGATSAVVRLMDRSLVSPTAQLTDPRRFRLLDPLRAFVLDRTDAAVVREVRRRHAEHHVELAGALRRRARRDDSRAAAAEAKRLCPEVNAAIGWALEVQDPGTALSLARALAVGGEQYGPDIDSLRSIARVAADPDVRNVATAEDLLDLGLALCYQDLDLVAELAALAGDRCADDRSALAARHLAGYADAYRHHPRSALAHLDEAERLADRLLDMWQLGSVRQARGIALGDLGDLDAAMAAFEAAMSTFALAGDAMHVNNARYMRAATAADGGRSTTEAISWAEQCTAYAGATGNRHELAHAVLTRARLTDQPEDEADLGRALETFRAVGDLRCLARVHLQLAGRRPPAERPALLGQALEVARTANDLVNQQRALEGLVTAHWEAGSPDGAATALGDLATLVGWESAYERCPPEMRAALDHTTAATGEGRAPGRGAKVPQRRDSI